VTAWISETLVSYLPQNYVASQPRRPQLKKNGVEQLFVYFKKVYDLIKGEVLHNILTGLGISRKLVNVNGTVFEQIIK
jgi:hypothetical protein